MAPGSVWPLVLSSSSPVHTWIPLIAAGKGRGALGADEHVPAPSNVLVSAFAWRASATDFT